MLPLDWMSLHCGSLFPQVQVDTQTCVADFCKMPLSPHVGPAVLAEVTYAVVSLAGEWY